MKTEDPHNEILLEVARGYTVRFFIRFAEIIDREIQFYRAGNFRKSYNSLNDFEKM